MANFALTVPTFPAGTVVKAYPASNWPTPAQPTGTPIGSATQEKTVSAAGTASFTTLTTNVEYWAAAEVGGVYRYVKMIVAAPPEVTGSRGSGAALTSLLAALATARIITDGTEA